MSSVLIATLPAGLLDHMNQNEARLYFHQYGSQYFLSDIWAGYSDTGVSIRETRTERELAKSASLRQPDTVAVLARR